MPKDNLYSIYSVAHTDGSALPFNNRGRTVRVVMAVNMRALSLRVRFFNGFGPSSVLVGAATLALSDQKGVLQPGGVCPVTVEGQLGFAISPGEKVTSDEIKLSIEPGQYLALSIYYPEEERVVSGNRLGNLALRSRRGNFSADPSLPALGLISRFSKTLIASGAAVQITSVCEVLAASEKSHRVIACFGDSITQQGNWTGPLEKRLLKRYPGQVSLCNLGIGGNRLLSGSPPAVRGLYGKAGVERFEQDVLELQGLTYAILALGVNDIGLPGAYGAPEEELITPAAYRTAMESLVAKLRERGVLVYAATLTPRTFQPPYDEGRERLRQEINTWIRSSPCFDAVLDFDRVLRREDGKPGMKNIFALPDGLHPSPLGGLWMAKSIDLSLFGGDVAG